MDTMKMLHWVAWILVIIGGINWLLVGLVKLDLVAAIFGDMSLLSRLVYILVGVSALYLLYLKFVKKQVNTMP